MSEGRSFTDRLASRTFWVTGALALFCMAAVILIAFRDQFFGSSSWCHFRAAGPEEPAVEACRDDERACQFERAQHCQKSPGTWTSLCAPQGATAEPLQPCRER